MDSSKDVASSKGQLESQHSAELPTPALTSAPLRDKARSLHFRIFATALLLMFVFKYMLWRADQGSSRSSQGDIMEGSPNLLPVPGGINIQHCAAWSNISLTPQTARNHAYATLELPVSSDALFFLSRGPRSFGSIEIDQTDDVGDVATVNVDVVYPDDDNLDGAEVCLLTREKGERGIGIFTEVSSDRRGLTFFVTVHLPKAPEGSKLHIKKFETDMPIFLHEVRDLGGVDFERVSFKTSNTPINIRYIHADAARLETSNSYLGGTFNTSKSLELITSNSLLEVDVTLSNDNRASTDLFMRNSNAKINAIINLVSTKSTGGKFKVTAKTALGGIDIKFPSAPVDSVLMLNAATSLATAAVQLHETYEGSFAAYTSMMHPSVTYSDDVEDPAGEGRQRKVKLDPAGRSYLSGSVSWDEERKGAGFVEVQTSMAQVQLVL